MAGAGAQLLSFEVAGQRLALPAADIREVVAGRSLTRVPQAPASLLGLTNLRGTALPVLSLATLLDRPEGTARRILVLDGASPVGLAVDTVLGLVNSEDREGGASALEAIDVAPLIARSFAGLASRAGRRGERVAVRRGGGGPPAAPQRAGGEQSGKGGRRAPP
ncbi:MAG: chemotaxis protein CheW, partial [Rhizorhabdus sp.]